MDIIKNPVIIGVFFATITYIYLYWSVNEKNEKNKKMSKSKKHHEKAEINLLIPLVVGLIAWFISFAYFQSDKIEGNNGINPINNINQNRVGLPIPIVRTPSYRYTKDVISESSDPKSFSLVTGGVTVPTKLPDMLLDMIN